MSTTHLVRSPVSTLPDEELVERIRAGDDDAFERLYRRYHRRICAYVLGMVHDHGRAEDLSQEVFLSALRRMRATDAPIAFRPWIYEIARNACIDQYRRARRSEEVFLEPDAAAGSADLARLPTIPGLPSPQAAAEQKESLGLLRGALGGLSESQRDVLVMRELEGRSYREIGERLELSRPSVESTLFRARRRLGEEYRELASGERCVQAQATIAGGSASGLGARPRRRLSEHLAHCEVCRRHARLAGLDEALFVRRSLRRRVAALLPFPVPALLRRRSGGSDPGATVAQWAPQLSASGDGLVSWSKVAAAAVTTALAGVGAGAAVHHHGVGTHAVPAASHHAAAARQTPARAAAVPPQGPTGHQAVRSRPRFAVVRSSSAAGTAEQAAGPVGGSAAAAGAGAPVAPASRPPSGAPASTAGSDHGPAAVPASKAPASTGGTSSSAAVPAAPAAPAPTPVAGAQDALGGLTDALTGGVAAGGSGSAAGAPPASDPAGAAASAVADGTKATVAAVGQVASPAADQLLGG